MRSSNKIKSIVFNLCTLIGIWLIFITSTFLLKHQKTELYKYIPTQYEYYGEINNQLINRKIANQLLFESPNDSLFIQLSEFVKQINNNPSKKTGINFLSNIVFFKAVINNTPFISFLLELDDPSQFNQQKFSESVYSFSQDGVGLVLFPLKPEPKSKTKFTQIASIIYKNHNKLLFNTIKKNELMGIHYKTSKYQIKVLDQKDGISIIGSIKDSNYKKGDELSFNNSNTSIHLTANCLPEFFSNYLQEKINQQLYKTPLIKGLSINYKGIEIKEGEEDDFSILPKIDAHFLLDSSISQKRFIKIFEPISNITIDTLNNCFKIGNEKYSYKLYKNHLYFGENTLKFQTKTTENLFQLNGNIPSLFAINGPSFITGFIEMLPPYYISKKYANNIQYVKINIKKNNKKSLTLVDGNIKMKNSKNIYRETLKMYLDFETSGL